MSPLTISTNEEARYNGVELGDYERFEGGKRVAKEPCGARQPEIAFSLMVALLFALDWWTK